MLPGNEAILLDTLLHEMTHMEAWLTHGERAHGRDWKSIAKRGGFGTTGVDELMASIGLTGGAFYGHFASKEALLGEVAARAWEQLNVALGTALSGFWILSANSWMHTPAGFAMEDGVAVPVNWFQIIFNPSFPYRLIHTVIASYLTTALVVGAVGAWHLLRDSTNAHARKMFSMAMWMAAIVAPIRPPTSTPSTSPREDL